MYLCITPKEIERIRKGLFPRIILILDAIKHLHSEPINFFRCLGSPLDSHRYECQLELRCCSLLHVADKINCRMSHHSPGLSLLLAVPFRFVAWNHPSIASQFSPDTAGPGFCYSKPAYLRIIVQEQWTLFCTRSCSPFLSSHEPGVRVCFYSKRHFWQISQGLALFFVFVSSFKKL